MLNKKTVKHSTKPLANGNSLLLDLIFQLYLEFCQSDMSADSVLIHLFYFLKYFINKLFYSSLLLFLSNKITVSLTAIFQK